jgi:hypothetical protein
VASQAVRGGAVVISTPTLKDKQLHEYHESWYKYSPARPSDDLINEGNWVLGEDSDLLEWENVTPDRGAIFEIVD